MKQLLLLYQISRNIVTVTMLMTIRVFAKSCRPLQVIIVVVPIRLLINITANVIPTATMIHATLAAIKMLRDNDIPGIHNSNAIFKAKAPNDPRWKNFFAGSIHLLSSITFTHTGQHLKYNYVQFHISTLVL